MQVLQTEIRKLYSTITLPKKVSHLAADGQEVYLQKYDKKISLKKMINIILELGKELSGTSTKLHLSQRVSAQKKME